MVDRIGLAIRQQAANGIIFFQVDTVLIMYCSVDGLAGEKRRPSHTRVRLAAAYLRRKVVANEAARAGYQYAQDKPLSAAKLAGIASASSTAGREIISAFSKIWLVIRNQLEVSGTVERAIASRRH